MSLTRNIGRLNIDSDGSLHNTRHVGSVGIGTTSPDRNLHVKKTDTGGTVAKFENSAGSTFIELASSAGGGANGGYIEYNATKDLSFHPDDTHAVTIKSNGKVGIKDTDPSDGLVVKGDTGYDTVAIKYSGTSGGHKSGYIFKDFRGQTNAGIYNNLQNDAVGTEAANMEFHTANGGTLTKQMNISKEGYINMPNTPAFYAYTTNDPNPASAAEYITSGAGWNWAESYDQTNSFSNGTFTAPVGGRYYFSIMWNRLAVQSRIAVRKNNSNYLRWEPTGRTDDAWESMHYSCMIYLAANDWVSLYGEYSGTSSHPFHMGSGNWGHFGGYLIA